MIKALLFDMDGTLVDIDFGGFLDEYLQLLVARFDHLGRPREVGKQVVSSVLAMFKNDVPGRTMLQAFIDDFFPALNLPMEQAEELRDFYQNEYRKLSHWGRPVEGARELLEVAFSRGLKIAVATAPLFPEIAIRERLRWGGVDDFDYDFISAADVMHVAKPFPGYYQQILDTLDVAPEECIMIGDEAAMDGAAERVGIRALLVGPERPSNMNLWFEGVVDAPEVKLPRYETMHDVRQALEEEGIL